MPTDQPSNAPDDLPEQPRDEASPGAVPSDAQPGGMPGGGGLGGAAAAGDRLDQVGGTGRNAAIDLGVTGAEDGDGSSKAGREAAALAADAAPDEGHPSSN